MISGYYACIADVSNAITYARRKIYKTLSLIIVMEIGAFIARCSWANVADFYNWYVGWLFDFNTPLEVAHGLYSALGGTLAAMEQVCLCPAVSVSDLYTC